MINHVVSRRLARHMARLLSVTLLVSSLVAVTDLLVGVPRAQAVSVGTAPCVQEVSSNSGVVVDRITSGSNTICVVRFTTVGSRTWTPPTGVTTLRVLVIAGGGGGGSGGWAGGGGAGGIVHGTSVSVTPGEARTVVVGGGGAGGNGTIANANSTCLLSHPGRGVNGSNSSFQAASTTLTAIGGGGGGGYGWGNRADCANGKQGGSGGGAGEANYSVTRATSTQATSGTPSSGSITAYGNSGGSTTITNGVQAGSGGGGAGAVGGDATAYRRPGNGGNGVSFDITGSSVAYGGGGGGATCSNCNAVPSRTSGGTGGGGAGGTTNISPGNGTLNTGGGGGGAQSGSGGSGGTGVVILRYMVPATPSTPTLATASDTGTSSSDRITSDSTPTINVAGIVSGATGTVTATKSGSSNVTCTISSGSCTLGTLADGVWSITAVQVLDGVTSPTSSALSVTIDTVRPTVSFSSVPSSPSTSRTLTYTLAFDEAVSGIAAGDFSNGATENPATCSFAANGSSLATAGSVILTATCTSDGVVVARVAIDAVTDTAGNLAPAAALDAAPVTVAAQLTVTYDSGGGTSIASGTTLIGGTIATSPGSPTRTGYEFAGWSATVEGSALTFPYTHGRTANFTLFALWTPDELEVSFNSRGGSPVSPIVTQTGASIASGNLPADPSRTGFTFAGWSLTSGGSVISFASPWAHGQTGDFTLFAVWISVPFTITYDLNYDPDGDPDTPDRTFATGSTSTGEQIATSPGSPTRSGFVFDGWSASATGFPVVFPYTHNKRANFTMYALWRSRSEPNNVWFYPGASASQNLTISAFPATLTPAFPRSIDVYTVTVSIGTPSGPDQLDRVEMCWYKSNASKAADAGVSAVCADASTKPQTEFRVVWDQSRDEFEKNGVNNYALGDSQSTLGDVTVTLDFKFQISNAMRAGNWTLVVTAYDDAGFTITASESANVASFVSIASSRAPQSFGVLARNGGSVLNNFEVGRFTNNVNSVFTISASAFTCVGCNTLALAAAGSAPVAGQVALECAIGATLPGNPTRITGTTQDLGDDLPETGEQRNGSKRMSCQLIYGGGASRALTEYSSTVVFGIRNKS
jgi:uncharacterized repeat protein (TIGR02543 family)